MKKEFEQIFELCDLVPAIIQDDESGEVLMLAYMNRESFARTLETGRTWFFSRSRGCLWNKGETSGNFQNVVSMHIDCDSDAILVKVKPMGPACHTGNRSCFYRRVK
ncbi:MAG: phosphoribosyl-AMP cyclohydrolase [Clostridia bacterium]|nr:phosphoribosyl-AMP cyclohydrolase [Clostridia bacterium]